MNLDYFFWRESADFDRGGAAVAALLGDRAAADSLTDHLHETGEADVTPLEVGKCYLIQTVTMYYVGRVAEIRGAFAVLEQASWVHWTGRLTSLCRSRDFKAGFKAGERKPRTEYLGDVAVNHAAMVAIIPGEWNLPTEAVAS